jgi:hypothetical protein
MSPNLNCTEPQTFAGIGGKEQASEFCNLPFRQGRLQYGHGMTTMMIVLLLVFVIWCFALAFVFFCEALFYLQAKERARCTFIHIAQVLYLPNIRAA